MWETVREALFIYWWLIGGFLLFLLLLIIIVKQARKSRFRKSIYDSHIQLKPKHIMKYSNILLHELSKDPSIFQKRKEIGEFWLQQVIEKKKAKPLEGLMTFGSEEYHFDCFMAALESKRLMELYYPYLQGEDDIYLIEKLAHSCKGRNFDGSKAEPFLKGSLYSLRDLTGSPDWDTRFFAYNLLVYSHDEKAQRSLWEGMQDPHPKVRILLLRKFQPEQRESFYTQLKSILVDDPSLEARKWARARIQQDFKDLYRLELEELDHYQKKHILELLDKDSDKDKNFALEILEDGELDLAQSAAGFLIEVGTLDHLFESVSCSDQKEMKRVENILSRAIDVGFQEFFDNEGPWDKEDCLLLASRILIERGDRQWLDRLAERVFQRDPKGSDFSWAIYKNTISAVDRRGSDFCQRMKAHEIEKYENHREILEALLKSIPSERGYLYKDLLMKVFKKDRFPCRDLLSKHLSQFYPSLILEDLLSILWDSESPLSVKQESLKLVIKMKQPYTLMTILENLPLLGFDDLLVVEKELLPFAGEAFDKAVEYLLKSYDATIRAAIIMILPKSVGTKYLGKIEGALKDSYADVRIAAAYKLNQMGKLKDSKEHLSLLRDPVQRVRVSSARIFSEMDSKNALLELDRLLKNDEEVQAVQESVVEALVLSDNEDSLEPLMDYLEHNPDMENFTIEALSKRYDHTYLYKLIEQFRDASPVLREKLVQVFILMKENAEESLSDILMEEIASLQSYLVEIMEQTGYIESLHRKLSHRDPLVRRKTTELLALIGTKSAFRGIVLASKDPDSQVRVNVTRALEKLNTQEGTELLRGLEEDPDKRVRRFTRWALERIKAKGRL